MRTKWILQNVTVSLVKSIAHVCALQCLYLTAIANGGIQTVVMLMVNAVFKFPMVKDRA